LGARELIAKLDLLGFERVIDIGCGDGKVTAAIASTMPNGTVTGIDSSPEMIGFAQQHFPKTCHPNLTFIRMDARYLTFSEEFDIIFQMPRFTGFLITGLFCKGLNAVWYKVERL
jgi:trans-aconitate 2-methyltransferase